LPVRIELLVANNGTLQVEYSTLDYAVVLNEKINSKHFAGGELFVFGEQKV